ncbi:hypothetical protein PFISCL1PPCAC_28049, partial [Pristionchus fissidentatus]
STYFWTRSIFFVIIPCTLLIVLNAGLIRGIRKAQQRKERLLREKRSRDAQRQTDSNSTSIMLVVIVTIFLMVNLPQVFIFIVFKLQICFLTGNFHGDHTMLTIPEKKQVNVLPTSVHFELIFLIRENYICALRLVFFRCRVCGRGEPESAAFADRKLENSAVPLVKFVPEDHTLNTYDENSIYRRDRRNDSVFL